MSDYANIVVGAPLMSLLSQTASGLKCDYRAVGHQVYRDLDLGTLDFGLLPTEWRRYQASLPDGICSTQLFADDFVCVVATSHKIGDVMSVDEYASLPHAAIWVGNGVRTIVEDAWRLSRLTPSISATSTTYVSLIAMVVNTPMVATVQRRLARRFIDTWPIRIFECPIPIEPLIAELAWHERNTSDPAYTYMRTCFSAVTTSLD